MRHAPSLNVDRAEAAAIAAHADRVQAVGLVAAEVGAADSPYSDVGNRIQKSDNCGEGSSSIGGRRPSLSTNGRKRSHTSTTFAW